VYILEVLQAGTYMVSIQPISSTKIKFGRLGGHVKKSHTNPCFEASYSYLIDTVKQDMKSIGLMDVVSIFFGGNALEDKMTE